MKQEYLSMKVVMINCGYVLKIDSVPYGATITMLLCICGQKMKYLTIFIKHRTWYMNIYLSLKCINKIFDAQNVMKTDSQFHNRLYKL